MRAFKCDRCGKFYGKYRLTNDYQFRGAPISVCHVRGDGEASEVMDLCEECRKELCKFMKPTDESDCDDCKSDLGTFNKDYITCRNCKHNVDGNMCIFDGDCELDCGFQGFALKREYKS